MIDDKPEAKRGRCEGCGEIVEIEGWTSKGNGWHTASEHSSDCTGYECHNCPVPIQCGPVHHTPTGSETAEEIGIDVVRMCWRQT